ncbi:MAG: Rrf2 family transcriptional regulator [Candidatus Gracilibacteria bacterium]|nr:Rrf2 family transcriptional regulator [Candidatus Gracilibacteria bacterium]
MIKLSTKGDYAIKTIIYLLKNNDSLVKISSISTSQKISESLLRRVVADMERSSIIETIKGRNGGIKISKPLNSISVYDVLLSVGEELGISDCTKGLSCDNHNNCQTTDLYNLLQKGFNGVLKVYTLDKLQKKES